MSRWFRLYDDTLNDPKILKLSDRTYRVWIGILCVASKNDGALPPFEDMALMLRMKPEKFQPELEKLITAGLIDHDDNGLRPHNWQGRQYKSDVSTERVKRFRNGGRNVSETPPETEQSTDTEAEKKESAALRAPPAPSPAVLRETKKRAKARAPLPDLWAISDVERAYAKDRGFADGQIASMATAFENHHRAKGSLMADWTAAWRTWCENEIKYNRGNGNGFGGSRPLQNAGNGNSGSVVAAAGRLRERLRAFDEPTPSELRGAEGGDVIRLLPKG